MVSKSVIFDVRFASLMAPPHLPLHDQVASHQLAQAAAVHVRHAAEVEHDLPLALKDDAGDGVAQQLGAVGLHQFPLQVED